MKKLNWFLKFCLMYGIAYWIPGPAYAQDQSDSAQQALQQLRLLQQRLSQNQPAGQQGLPPGQAAPAPAPGQTPPPAQNQGPNIPIPLAGNIYKPPAAAQTPPPAAAAPNPNAPQIISQTDEEVIDNKAFKDMTRNIYPLSTEQIVHLRQISETMEYAKASPAGTPPKPTATSQFVNLSPGSTPPVIRLAQGFVSSLVFLDSSGAPWPIAAYDLGDPNSFNIQWDKTSNTIMIQAMKLYNYGNLAVRLRGLNTPVMLTLIPGQKAVDYRVDLRVQGFGPNAKTMPLETGIPPSASELLLHVLDGVPPPGSKRLSITGGDARAWLANDRMYVRTNLTILSPGWLASMTSADGTHAYEMQKSPVLLVSWHGKVMQLKVEGL
ncbi:DotH/IcmK family type IV secretion protein [Legionella anisa]|uniref:Type IV secretion protein IcmK n=1 Tax=Legionella anisa TaxID=28082 RepID=A0AAX0WPP8_9GAMM|nr:DotH/IcmK family type IV secretion protein [Legionella anisa]KTC72749.1 IcmK protein [Legionella anisa]MBN5936903.1 DotH/IcmK family type IV secretion protein [Legionella anisa]PNL60713.1 type IV secretion protein IcmK [Legionella anisa]UAK80536.1 DotH/IcmK family type IV secretion protein [Legionella anisa]